MIEFNHILNALPWPSLLVGPDLRVGKFNSAAQSMFRLEGSDTLLVNIMRHPSVLEAVDVSLTAGWRAGSDAHDPTAYYHPGARCAKVSSTIHS